jgi:hypothetical protein
MLINFFDVPLPKGQESLFDADRVKVSNKLEIPCRNFHKVADYENEYGFGRNCFDFSSTELNFHACFVSNC